MYKRTFLIQLKTKWVPIHTQDIVYCYTNKKSTLLVTSKNEYPVNRSLEELEKELDPSEFFRANRQFIISHNHIKEIEQYMTRKLEIVLDRSVAFPILVSRERAAAFRNWMENIPKRIR